MGFEAVPHPGCDLTFIVEKTHHGPAIALFLCNFWSFFSYVGGVLVTKLFSLLLTDRYILAIQQIITREEHLWYSFWSVAAFWLSVLIRSAGTIVITTESGQNNLKVISTKQFLTKTTIFRCFDVFSVRPTKIFQVQAKISTIRAAFPNCLSHSYD